MGVPFTVVVEEDEAEEYRAVVRGGDVLVLDPRYQRAYDPCVDLQPGESKGSGPARNFIWDHAAASGAERHWVIDDNVRNLYRIHLNRKLRVGDGTGFRVMEDFVDRYRNVAIAGPNYEAFDQTGGRPPFQMNTRIYSCILLKTDLPYRWRGRYNEDTDLSLRVLKDGWCTVLFNAFQQDKIATQRMRGGNTDEVYADGTTAKSLMLVRLHPDVAKPAMRFGREHHYVDYRRFRNQRLLLREDVEISDGPDNYGLELVERDPKLGQR
jgi:hypothetical protein